MVRLVFASLLCALGSAAGFADMIAWEDGRVWQNVQVTEFRVADGESQFRVEPTEQSTPMGVKAGWYSGAKRIDFSQPTVTRTVEDAPARSGYPPIGATITEVVQADTLRLDTGQKVRLLGVDTPETTDPDRPLEFFGSEAYLFTKERVEDKHVRIEFDKRRMDNFGRLLGYVYLADGTFLNLEIVRSGHGHAWFGEPMSRAREAEFRAAENLARNRQAGLWDLDEREAARSPWQIAKPVTRAPATSQYSSQPSPYESRRDYTRPRRGRGRPIVVEFDYEESPAFVLPGPFGFGFPMGRRTEFEVRPR